MINYSVNVNFTVSKEGLKTYCHFLELFVEERARRAEIQFLNALKNENTSTSEESIVSVNNSSTTHTIEFENLEQVFVQLLLDF